MLFLLLVGLCFVTTVYYYWSSSHLANSPSENFSSVDEPAQLAEIDGGTWEQLSVFEHVERGLNKSPDRPAIICLFQQSAGLEEMLAACIPENTLYMNKGTSAARATRTEDASTFTLSYTQLHQTALRLATGLICDGARPNTTMLMLIPNGGEYAILLWACILLRITYVNIDPVCLEDPDDKALKYTLQTTKPQVVIVPDTLSGKAIDAVLVELELPEPIRVCLVQSVSTIANHKWRSLADIVSLSKLRSHVSNANLVSTARRDRNPKRINSIMFTSGTSGIPKGCPQSVSAISHALHSQEWLIDSDSGTAHLAIMQPHNSRGIAPAQTLQTWRAGGAVVLTGQSFSVGDAIKAIKQVRATFLVLTPPMVHGFSIELATRPLDVSCVKRVQVGGDAVTKEVLIKCAALFSQAQVCVNQGMTEGPGVFTWPFLKTAPGMIPFLGGQVCPVGIVAPGARVRICSITSHDIKTQARRVVKRGQLGELHISCPSIIRHYLGGRSEESFYDDEKGRWFNTGDMAIIDGQGLVFIVGRRKDMIQRAGVTIAPAVIESCIAAFTQTQAVVVAAPHSVLGAEPFAIVNSFEYRTKEKIKHYVQTVLGKNYALGDIVTLEQLGLVEFPVNATHKIIKSELQNAVVKHLQRTTSTQIPA
ncbi:putative amp dependent CoA ligase [Dothidotthia symphoricarpi CBS 119687]|uniref:Putative amp dependent CoA ligase n=1 Tax=Dothidotthia symphoricarpi CBS 119687 TaxID=1392245 RepID=A0A6A6ANS8_9PLEO|nr:putative amp dependent CoA ligase [Dothidotthia symphoricarpi CBS 119687]KAF2133652.1 putative amp dependent CoA ligase [Dothidotthia symphoricarpi CBS 119687]